MKAIKTTLKEIAGLMGTAVILALVVNALSPVGIPLLGRWNISQGVVSANGRELSVVNDLEISDVSSAKRIWDASKTLYVDARSRQDYEAGHIAGAVSLPLGEFDIHIDTFIMQYPPEQPMVTYCSGRTCEDSHNLAQLLMDFGYSDVKVFIDGYPGWEAEGYPVE